MHEQLSLYENSAIDKFQNLLQDRKKFYVRGVTDMLYLAPTTGTEGAIRHLRNTASLWGAALVTAVSAHASPRLSKSNSSAVSRLQLSSTAAAGTISLPQPAALNPLSNVVTSARSTSSTSDKVLCFSCCCRMFSLSGIHLRRLLRIVEKRMCMRAANLLVGNLADQLQQRKQNINQGLVNLTKLHSQLSLPDKELRESLCECVCAELVPVYQSFREKSLHISFTSRRDKYIRYTPEEFLERLRLLYISGAAVLT
ncbi:unnamed protein product [Schistocephalus solidus]|uniref:Exocyst complex subunit Exo70 C-terminal domain-containing protein n=1 Tax=Schistocephalus solidus TaxID=70667 RepID=A0A3P7CVX2_SCHSO|nr:unnamed protein product [Schistocephalus solidus]